MSKQPTGYVFYRGLSTIDGESIVAIAITHSTNRKTGDMVQTYIFRDNGATPFENAASGDDYSICGSCEHRRTGDKGDCYVNLARGPAVVWRRYKAGLYPDSFEGAYTMCRDRRVRLGAYGDPFAVPFIVWNVLLRAANGWTGYTQAWKEPYFENNREVMAYCMASVNNAAEWVMAREKGYRTYRIRGSADEPLLANEFACPASEERDHARTCAQCMACNGLHETNKATPVIVVHGRYGRKKHGLERKNASGTDL